MSAQARSYIADALKALDHVEGRTRTERRAVEMARGLLKAADRDLSGERPEPLPELGPVHTGPSAASLRRRCQYGWRR